MKSVKHDELMEMMMMMMMMMMVMVMVMVMVMMMMMMMMMINHIPHFKAESDQSIISNQSFPPNSSSYTIDFILAPISNCLPRVPTQGNPPGLPTITVSM